MRRSGSLLAGIFRLIGKIFVNRWLLLGLILLIIAIAVIFVFTDMATQGWFENLQPR